MRALPVALCGVLVGWGAGFWGARQVLAGLARSSLVRVNYRNREVVAGLGLLLPLGLLVWAAPLAVASRVDPLRAVRAGLLAPSGLAVVVAGVAFLVLGLVDDLVEDPGGSRGFRGHLRALASGRLTGGGVKLLGGPLAGPLGAGGAPPGGRPARAGRLGGQHRQPARPAPGALRQGVPAPVGGGLPARPGWRRLVGRAGRGRPGRPALRPARGGHARRRRRQRPRRGGRHAAPGRPDVAAVGGRGRPRRPPAGRRAGVV